ncbi:MAG: type II toxin-antitoxin system VapC family toxin [Chloroflexota bacterium]
MALVVDANTVVAACLAAGDGFAEFDDQELIAPDLMWWEAASTLHEYLWLIEADRRTTDMVDLEREDVLAGLNRLRQAPVQAVPVNVDVVDEAWHVADRCGFAKVYDAAYVAVARLKGATLVTLDRRLCASPAAKLVPIVGPADVVSHGMAPVSDP